MTDFISKEERKGFRDFTVDEVKAMKQFRENFGFNAYDGVTSIMSKMYAKIEELYHSREKWKKKYKKVSEELKAKK
jgi:uncharacterized protein (DUF2147 family)